MLCLSGFEQYSRWVPLRSLQYDAYNLGTRFLSTCYSNFWWIPSYTLCLLSLSLALNFLR